MSSANRWNLPISSPPPRSPADELRWALSLFEQGWWLTRERFRREYPDAEDAEIDRRMDEWLVPPEPAGDAPGVARRWVP